MSKPIATAIFAGPYGGEEQVHIKRTRDGFRFKAPAYVAASNKTAEGAKARAEKTHNFIRWN